MKNYKNNTCNSKNNRKSRTISMSWKNNKRLNISKNKLNNKK